jgi:hypothetical protein
MENPTTIIEEQVICGKPTRGRILKNAYADTWGQK